MYGIIQFEQHVPFRVFLFVTSDRVQCPRVGVYVPLRALFLVFCSNDNTGLTTYFTAWSNFATWAFIWENVAMMMDSLKIIASCDLEFDLYSKLNF